MMKRLTFITLALLAIVGRVCAQESVSVKSITVPQGGEAFLEVNYSLEGAGPYVGFMFLVDLPEGLSLAEDPDGEPGYPWYDEDVTAISRLGITTTPTGFAGTPKTPESTINGNSGVLMRVKVAAASSLAVGSTHTGKITELSFNVRDENYNVTKVSLDDVTFDITIGEAGSMVLDENSTSPIMDGSFETVILKRTFAAGWNTICLPFDIEDVEETFGEGARAYGFTKYADGDLSFSPTESLSATKPYVIYVPKAITEVEIEEVEIDGSNTKSSYTLKNKAYFRGTYAPVAPGEWTKKTDTDDIYGVTTDGKILKAGPEASIKGFRAYFDVPAGAAVKALVIEDDETGITSPLGETGQEAIYNVAGQRLSKKQKGVNIVNGKKILK
jgi:hypothetical protein